MKKKKRSQIKWKPTNNNLLNKSWVETKTRLRTFIDSKREREKKKQIFFFNF